MKRIVILLILGCFLFVGIINATVINVPYDQPTIQMGIIYASNDDTVLVHPNTYQESVNFIGRRITVGSLYLTTQDTSYISQTVIDGMDMWVSVTFAAGEDSSAILSGFTITQGFGTNGGGILCDSVTSPTITACRIIDNQGNGIYCYYSSPRMDSCTIIFNTIHGINIVGTSNPTIYNCYISDNLGNGIDCEDGSPTISGCTISSNSGRGLKFTGDSQVSISGCDLEYNSSHGIFLGPNPQPTVTGNNINNNSGYPVVAYPDQLGRFSGNTYMGNVTPYIYVYGGNIPLDATWENPDIPYFIAGDISIQGTDGDDNVTTLTLESGTELRFLSETGITVGNNTSSALIGALCAIGTESDSIKFTAHTGSPSPGYWDGIYFAYWLSDSLTQLSHCIVEYGGYSSNENIFCMGCSPEISHSDIHHGSGHGVYCTISTAYPDITDCYIHHHTGDGVYCENGSPILTGCTISSNSSRGIMMDGYSYPTIIGCDIEYNSNGGIYLLSDLSRPTVTGNNISNNGSNPVVAYSDQIGEFSGNTYINNGLQRIWVYGGITNHDATWENPGIPYIISGDMTIYGTDGPDNVSTLILESGVEMCFANESGLTVGDDFSSLLPGALIANGTETDSIIFTGITPSPGSWDGIYFAYWAPDSLSQLTYCLVEYGGMDSAASIYCNGTSPLITNTEIRYGLYSGIFCDGSHGNPRITNCYIHDNSWYGIHCDWASPIISGCAISSNSARGIITDGISYPMISGCDIEYNSSGGIYVLSDLSRPTVTGNNISNNGSNPVVAYSDQIGEFSGNTYNNNGLQRIWVYGGITNHDATWENPGIPYVISGDMTIYGNDGPDNVSTLILESGVEMCFANESGLTVGDDFSSLLPGALIANGTETDSIIFRGITPSPGSWDGIYFADYSVDSLSVMEYCIVEYGGYSGNENIYCHSSSPSITHSEVHHGSGTGIQCYNDANPNITDCQVHNNTSYGIACNISSPVLTRCVVYSNATHGVFATGASTLATIINNTISDNSYGVYCNNNSTAIVTNSILWDNSTQNMYVAAGCSSQVSYSDIQGGWTGTGNINNNPLFWDAASNDYRLTIMSPCIDTGDPGSPLDPDSTRVDMGAYFFDHLLGCPVITAITDVPEDQGRYVIVTWDRSPLDSFAASIPIVGYNLWELWPFEDSTRTTTHDINEVITHPELLFMTDDTTWIHISYIAAMQWDEYNVLAETFRDSSGVAENPSHFFVSAHTTTPYWYYKSEVAVGYSLDNIPPNPVVDAIITANPGLISINWSEISEGSWQGNSYPELNGVWYRVYGSDNPSFTPNPGNLLMVTEHPTFQHDIEEFTKYFYIIQSSDDH